MRSWNKPNWFRQREKGLGATGTLDLSGEVFDDLSFVGSRSSMKTLNLSFTSVPSFEGLALQPKIEHLILGGSSIESLKNSSSISTITKITIHNSPICKYPNFRISLLLAFPDLRIINGKIIPQRLRDKVETYPPVAARLVDGGWIAEYPCPSDDELRELCIELGVRYEAKVEPEIEEIPLFEERDIDDVIERYNAHHQRMLEKAQEKLQRDFLDDNDQSISLTQSSLTASKTDEYELYDDGFEIMDTRDESLLDYDPNRLSVRVIEVIKRNGFDVDDGDPVETIIAALSKIFEIAEGQDVDFPNVLIDGNEIVSDEESEEESLADFKKNDTTTSLPPVPRTKVVFEESFQPRDYDAVSPVTPEITSQNEHYSNRELDTIEQNYLNTMEEDSFEHEEENPSVEVSEAHTNSSFKEEEDQEAIMSRLRGISIPNESNILPEDNEAHEEEFMHLSDEEEEYSDQLEFKTSINLNEEEDAEIIQSFKEDQIYQEEEEVVISDNENENETNLSENSGAEEDS